MFGRNKQNNEGYMLTPIKPRKDDGLGVMGWTIGIISLILILDAVEEDMSKPETDPELRYLTEADRAEVLRERAAANSN